MTSSSRNLIVLSVPQPWSGSVDGNDPSADAIPAGDAIVGRALSSSDRRLMASVTRGRTRENSDSPSEVLMARGFQAE